MDTMARSASSNSGQAPRGTWRDPSTAKGWAEKSGAWLGSWSYTADWQPAPWPTDRSDAAASYRSGYGRDPPTRTKNRSDKHPGGKGTKGAQLKREPEDYVPFEPHLVYRVVLPLSPAAMGQGWWKKEVTNALEFGVKVSWRSMRRMPGVEETDKTLYARPPSFPLQRDKTYCRTLQRRWLGTSQSYSHTGHHRVRCPSWVCLGADAEPDPPCLSQGARHL